MSSLRNLNRNFNRRRSLVRSLANDLIMYEKVDTTLPRAKATQSFVERLITKAKKNSLVNKRQVESALGLDNTVRKMFEIIGPKFKERPGGYTRIVKMGSRVGDNSIIARLEFSEVVSRVVDKPKAVKVEETKKGPALLKRKPKVTVTKTTKVLVNEKRAASAKTSIGKQVKRQKKV